MTIKEFLDENPNLDEHSFGNFIRQRREKLNMSVRGLATEMSITPAYLSDIEKGNRHAPSKKHMDRLKELLKISKEEEQDFNDLASVTRGNAFEDISPYLQKNALARVALRKAMDRDISDEHWKRIIKGFDDTD